MILQLQMRDTDARLILYALRKRFGLPEKKGQIRALNTHLQPLVTLLIKSAVAEELRKDSDEAMKRLESATIIEGEGDGTETRSEVQQGIQQR